MRLFRFLILIFSLLIGVIASSAENAPLLKKKVYDYGKKPVQNLVKTRNRITDGVKRFSSGIDSFFAAERSEAESNKSHIKLRVQSIFEQYEKADLDLKITGRLSLPRTEERLQLIVESEDENNIDSGDAQVNNPNEDAEENTTSAGLRYFLDNNDRNFKWNIDGGIRIDSGVDPFIGTRFRKSYFHDAWEFRFVETVEWVDSTGVSAKSEYIMDRPFAGRFLFRQYNGARWREINDTITMYHSYNIIHQFKKKQAISYQIGMQGLNRPALFAETYYASVSFRALIYKNWLYMTLQPGYIYRKEDQFRQRRQLLLLFDVFFGDP